MSIVETLQRPVDTNGSVNTHRRAAKRRLESCKGNERPNRAETTASVAELQGQRERAIEDEATAVLRTSSYHAVRHVSCEVCNRVLALRGRVPSFYMKQMAQTAVRHLLDRGLVIDNQLEVDRT